VQRLRQAFRVLTLFGYFAVLGLTVGHCIFWAPPQRAPIALALTLATVPLLLPLRGLLHERSYTHAWTSLLALLYFVLGVDTVATSTGPPWLGWAEIMASLMLFSGAVGYVQCKAREARGSTC
jgi:uncharacterized membrane protein